MSANTQKTKVVEKGGADLGDMIGTFKGIADNPL